MRITDNWENISAVYGSSKRVKLHNVGNFPIVLKVEYITLVDLEDS